MKPVCDETQSPPARFLSLLSDDKARAKNVQATKNYLIKAMRESGCGFGIPDYTDYKTWDAQATLDSHWSLTDLAQWALEGIAFHEMKQDGVVVEVRRKPGDNWCTVVLAEQVNEYHANERAYFKRNPKGEEFRFPVNEGAFNEQNL